MSSPRASFDNFEFKAGDLVKVKDGCGKEGEVGLVLKALERNHMHFNFLPVSFSDGISDISTFWLEPLNEN